MPFRWLRPFQKDKYFCYDAFALKEYAIFRIAHDIKQHSHLTKYFKKHIIYFYESNQT